MVDDSAMQRLADALAREPRFAAAILFGSVARGTARADSDIDIGVLIDSAAARTSLEAELTDVLGAFGLIARRNVHLVDLTAADSALRRSIFATGQVIFDRSRHRLRDLHAATLIEYFDWEYARRIIDEGQRRELEQVHA